MGLLSEGHPLSWEETKQLAEHVRQHGIMQFINLYARLRDKTGDILKFGDEVEFVIVKFDNENKRAMLRLCAGEVLHKLNEKEHANPNVKTLWRPEYAAYMIEGTPGKPYGGTLAEFNKVEENMRLRREEVQELLGSDEVIMTLTVFPRLGCPGFTWPAYNPTPIEGASRSLFFPDQAIHSDHPRFTTLTRNIRMRRGEKVAVNVPIFKDENTPSPFIEDLYAYGDTGESAEAALTDHIYLDAMGFGMGCSCLQVTFQACCIAEARVLYDQLSVFCPILLALTAASPVFRGYLTDIDSRWGVISASVDCRTKQERGLEPLKHNRFRIPKSRYDSIDSYLSEYGESLNDVPVLYDEAVYSKLVNSGIDHLLAQHIAHLFIRDTVSLFSEKVNQDDEIDTDHFENIQSTNWQSMRFKPPPPNSDIGWRVEFRPCEIQFTDFENAAFVCFVVLLTRVILSYKLNFLIPISKAEENMKTAQRRDSLRKEKFWFRTNINLSSCLCNELKAKHSVEYNADSPTNPPVCELLTIDEIINGKDGKFPGVGKLLEAYLASMESDADAHCTMQRYLSFIKHKASGDLMSTATWIRKFIRSHPKYRFDSVVSEEISYDLLKFVYDIQQGKVGCPELFGEFSDIKQNKNSR